MLRDIVQAVPQVVALRQVIAATAADVLVLGDMDYDAGGVALGALNAGLAEPYPFAVALQGNAGIDTGRDLDGDGRMGGPRDMQAYGRFAGQAGLAVLSRVPVGEAVSLNALLWRDLPGNLMNSGEKDGAGAVQRLSTGGHWIVPLRLADGRTLTLLLFHATPPVFDGPEDRNGRRNHDEIALWRVVLDGGLDVAPLAQPFVLAGTANIDPEKGEGRREALQALLADPRLTDPRPGSPGGAAAGDGRQGGDVSQEGDGRLAGDRSLDTVDWREPVPGNLRVDYVLPSSELRVAGAGVLWPEPEAPLAESVAAASRHRFVWVDILP